MSIPKRRETNEKQARTSKRRGRCELVGKVGREVTA
jgi:hypothetical protein